MLTVYIVSWLPAAGLITDIPLRMMISQVKRDMNLQHGKGSVLRKNFGVIGIKCGVT